MPESRRPRRRAGLTLIATLVAVTVLGLVGTSVENHLSPTSLAISGTSSAHGEDLARRRFGDSSPVALLRSFPFREAPTVVPAEFPGRHLEVIPGLSAPGGSAPESAAVERDFK